MYKTDNRLAIDIDKVSSYISQHLPPIKWLLNQINLWYDEIDSKSPLIIVPLKTEIWSFWSDAVYVCE